MKLRTTSVLLLLLLALAAFALGGCGSTSEQTTDTTEAVSGETAASSEATSSTEVAKPVEPKTIEIGDVAKVEQGSLSVSKVTVTGNLTSSEANALLYTGEAGEGKNVSKAPAAGKEFLMITFAYKKAAWYEFRGGVYPSDLILKKADGTEYPLVETTGFGGIYNSKAGEVKPDVEASTTAVFEVPKGETGLVLVYHTEYPDMFYCNIR
jgi:hypothetical protein